MPELAVLVGEGDFGGVEDAAVEVESAGEVEALPGAGAALDVAFADAVDAELDAAGGAEAGFGAEGDDEGGGADREGAGEIEVADVDGLFEAQVVAIEDEVDVQVAEEGDGGAEKAARDKVAAVVEFGLVEGDGAGVRGGGDGLLDPFPGGPRCRGSRRTRLRGRV